ncbi:hypothetical protein [Acidovorax sp. Root70]|uniref:hypothetical protein n=1 Tax=Acidovorax sp. Root70 TaxID=1736590 RepID=UPI0006F8A93D|nr:hypothetical protein [Acidovorax sp. Root70]KRB42305.1 hypothetical protein ASD94_01010 [Acidovorax sp. Root70]
MNRCTTPSSCHPPAHRVSRFRQAALLAAVACTALCAVAPASAQTQPGLGLSRPFPEAALRGTLSINTASEATLNGKTIRMAPGMRLFSPQNTLVMAHTVLGQTFKVNYVQENSTGMLHAAWILTEGEAAQPRKGSDAIITNITTGSGAALK